jgi:hypothetical protein
MFSLDLNSTVAFQEALKHHPQPETLPEGTFELLDSIRASFDRFTGNSLKELILAIEKDHEGTVQFDSTAEGHAGVFLLPETMNEQGQGLMVAYADWQKATPQELGLVLESIPTPRVVDAWAAPFANSGWAWREGKEGKDVRMSFPEDCVHVSTGGERFDDIAKHAEFFERDVLPQIFVGPMWGEVPSLAQQKGYSRAA